MTRISRRERGLNIRGVPGTIEKLYMDKTSEGSLTGKRAMGAQQGQKTE